MFGTIYVSDKASSQAKLLTQRCCHPHCMIQKILQNKDFPFELLNNFQKQDYKTGTAPIVIHHLNTLNIKTHHFMPICNKTL